MLGQRLLPVIPALVILLSLASVVRGQPLAPLYLPAGKTAPTSGVFLPGEVGVKLQAKLEDYRLLKAELELRKRESESLREANQALKKQLELQRERVVDYQGLAHEARTAAVAQRRRNTIDRVLLGLLFLLK